MYLGIDLGTSNSTIAGVEDGVARVFHPTDGGEALPSVIYIDKRGHRLYGRRAYDQAMTSPENVAAGFKRLMGTSTPIEIKGAGVTLTPEECSADILRQLLGQASTETGLDSFEGTVVAIPASFNQMQAEATLRAAQAAGLEKVDLIQEPIAAALTVVAGSKRSGKFLIYDLGGGTFDLALIESDHGKVRLLAQQGVNMLGGRDFDRLIVSEIVRSWLSANFDLPDMFLSDPLYRRLGRIALLASEKAKIDLSSLEMAAIFASDDEIRLMDQSETEIFLDAPITRAQFEEMIREPIEQTISLVRTILKENNLETGDIDRIVFIGGSTRIPLIRHLVTDSLGIAADLHTDPMNAVAEGAALYCRMKHLASENAPTAETSGPNEAAKEEPAHAQIGMESEPDLYFDYDIRTTDNKTTVHVHVEGGAGKRKIRLSSEGWDSGFLDLRDGLDIKVPLSKIGANAFTVHVLGASGKSIDEHTRELTITRMVAESVSVPAAHSIAVKVRKSLDAEENEFLFLVHKGDKLPSSGEIAVKSGSNLKAETPGYIGFEVFQVEYPERVEVNLCVGLFRIENTDLPQGQSIRKGDPIVFGWQMDESGLLRASVRLPSNNIDLKAPHFYAPQAGQLSYDGIGGESFARAILDRAREEWGDLAAAVGPAAGPEIGFLKTRLYEQLEILEEAAGDAENLRRVSEDARFIRQDTAKLGQKYAAPLLQRHTGKLQAAFNRVCRSKAEQKEADYFDELTEKVQQIIDEERRTAFPVATVYLSEMRRLFFAVAWKDAAYVRALFDKLSQEPWLFADQDAFNAWVEEGKKKRGDLDALREIVTQMQGARVALGASDAVNDLATIVKE